MGVASCCSPQSFIHGDINGEVVVRDGLLGLQQSGSYHLARRKEREEGGRRKEERGKKRGERREGREEGERGRGKRRGMKRRKIGEKEGEGRKVGGHEGIN